ncbi:MAG: IS110 family transposase [Deltaproteobacteria bacterium]|nr:IS110 family transposase [Deltaproteobacteria bacterium]
MNKYTIKFFVGMDLGDKKDNICVLDHDSAIVESTSVSNTAIALNRFFERFDTPQEVLVAMETGTHSPWISHLLKARGFRVLIGNARKLRAIWDTDNKYDDRDAEMLARIARFDPELLYPITHRSRAAHMDLALIKARNALVQCRSKLINFLRGISKTAGERLPSCSAEAFVRNVAEHIPEELLPAAMPCLNMIHDLNTQIRHLDRQIEKLCAESYPEAMGLREIVGVGPITALSYVLTVEDPHRFPKSRNVGPYLGLTPKRDQSGQSDKPLSITKAGNSYLRSLLINSAHYILGPFGPDCLLRRYGMRIASRGGKIAKRKAAVAVARKLAVLMHRLWINNEIYDPWYHDFKKAA